MRGPQFRVGALFRKLKQDSLRGLYVLQGSPGSFRGVPCLGSVGHTPEFSLGRGGLEWQLLKRNPLEIAAALVGSLHAYNRCSITPHLTWKVRMSNARVEGSEQKKVLMHKK